MAQIAIAADLREESPNRVAALNTYHALKDSNTVAFVWIGDQVEIIRGMGLPYVNINEIKHSIIITFRELKNYISIDRTNTLVYLATHDRIESFMSFMIHRVDCIVAPNYRVAHRLCSAVQQLNLETPVYRIQPWLDPAEYGLNEPGSKLRLAILDPDDLLDGMVFPEFEVIEGLPELWADKVDIYVHLSGGDFQVRETMMSGIIPITWNKLPYSEFIINETNGFLVNSIQEIGGYLKNLNENREEYYTIRAVALRSAQTQMSKKTWADLLVKTALGQGAENLNDDDLFSSVIPTYRRWIIPKTILRGGDKMFIPRQYNKNRFRMVELHTLEEILVYFSAQKFMDVFIFDWDYGPYDVESRNRILNLTKAIGRRGLNMYWCSDQPIPQEWAEVFNTMTVLSTEDGLKKVAPLGNQNYMKVDRSTLR
jgi:hypothetical protein